MASISKYKTKKGDFYRIQLYVGKDANGKRITKTVRGFKTKREAKMAADKLSAEIASGNFLEKTDLTFSDVYEHWLDTYKLTVREHTLMCVESLFKAHILPILGDTPIQKITARKCQLMVNSLAQSNLTSIKNYAIQASRIFEFAISMDYINKNPFDKVIIPKIKKAPKPPKFYTRDELELFLDTAQKICPPKIYTLLRLLAFSGMRIGEAFALTWDDIDLASKSISINKTVTYSKKSKATISEPKTQASKRTVYIDKKTLFILQQWQKIQRIKLLEIGFNANSPQQLVFANSNNSFISGVVLRYWINKVRKKIDLHPISPHGFRHTYATLAIQSGMNPKELQAQLGHSNIHTTLQIYTAITDEQRIATPDKFTSFVNF